MLGIQDTNLCQWLNHIACIQANNIAEEAVDLELGASFSSDLVKVPFSSIDHQLFFIAKVPRRRANGVRSYSSEDSLKKV